jgi:hypothetical protein
VPRQLRPASEVLPTAVEVLARVRGELPEVPDAVLELTGGSSTPGALTGGDVDLHLRVPPEHFGATVELLRGRHAVVHPEIWCETLATFSIADVPEVDVGLAVTPIGSVHDRHFRVAWERLRGDPSALAAYNAMKVRHADADAPTYDAAKSAFFTELTSPE